MIAGHPELWEAHEPLLKRTVLREKLAALGKRVREAARRDPVCHRLMTIPGVGAVVALTFRAAVDRRTSASIYVKIQRLRQCL